MRIEAKTSEVILLRGRNMATEGSSRRSTNDTQYKDALHGLKSLEVGYWIGGFQAFLVRLEPLQRQGRLPHTRQDSSSAIVSPLASSQGRDASMNYSLKWTCIKTCQTSSDIVEYVMVQVDLSVPGKKPALKYV